MTSAKLILFLLLLFTQFNRVMAATTVREQWLGLAEKLDSESAAREKAIAQLKDIKNLDALLTEELQKDKGHDFYLVMQTISVLHEYRLVPQLIAAIDTVKADEQMDLLHAIVNLRNAENEESILRALNKKFPLNDDKISFVIRGIVADACLQSSKIPSPEILQALLKDSNSSLRVRAVNLASKRISDPEYLAVIKNAFATMPYQVPLAAVRAIELGDKHLVEKFHAELEKCSRSDFPSLKAACSAALK